MNPADRYPCINLAMKDGAMLRDVELVRAAQAGSSAAFAELQRLYSRRLYSAIMRITKNREDAEDALQDSFLQAFLFLCRFEGRSSFYSWLKRIGINSALMILRRRRNRAEVSLELPSDTPGEFSQLEIRDCNLDPEQICDQRQRWDHAVQSLERLEPSLRAAIQLQLTHDCSLKEIAQTLSITEAAVKARLYRARRRLIMRACGNREAQRQIASHAV
jgi:RNA polymerase sigma-70 factor (ECF subfamily)